MEGIVAGVPRLAQYDVDIDAGADASDPENAVSFSLELPDGETLKQPGNLFFVTETSLYGTNPDFLAKGVDAGRRRRRQGGVRRGRPGREHLRRRGARVRRAWRTSLDADAQEFEPTPSDAFTAITVMTPTMSEYFEAWKNSRFIAGEDATELGFVAASRLSDIADILEGIVFTYDEIEPQIAEESPQQAEQTGKALKDLLAYVEDIRDREDERQEVHRRAGGHARLRGTAPGRGDRRPGDAGRAAARDRAAGGIGLGPAPGNAVAGSAPDPAAPGGGRRVACRDDRRVRVPDGRRGDAAVAGGRDRSARPCSRRRPRLLLDGGAGEPPLAAARAGGRRTARVAISRASRPRSCATCGRRWRRRRAAVAAGDETALAAARGRAVGGAAPRGVRRGRRGGRAAATRATARSWLLIRDFRAGDPLHAARGRRDHRPRRARRGRDRAARAAVTQVRKDLLDAYQARLGDYLDEAEQEHERGFGPALGRVGGARARLLADPRLRVRGSSGAPRRRGERPRLRRTGAGGGGRATARRSPGAKTPCRDDLDGFTAAPFTPEEQARRARAADPVPRPGPDRVRRRHGGRARSRSRSSCRRRVAFIGRCPGRARTTSRRRWTSVDPGGVAISRGPFAELRELRAPRPSEGGEVAPLEDVEAAHDEAGDDPRRGCSRGVEGVQRRGGLRPDRHQPRPDGGRRLRRPSASRPSRRA